MRLCTAPPNPYGSHQESHLGLQEAAIGRVGGASPLPLLPFALDLWKGRHSSHRLPAQPVRDSCL